MTGEDKKKSAIIILIALILILLGVFIYNKYYYKAKIINLPGSSSPTEETAKNFTMDDYNDLMTDGLKYKTEGDAGNKASYDKAIFAFVMAAKVSEEKYWLPFINLGNTYRSAGNFSEADKAYDKAMEISGGGEITVYQAKIDSWRADPGKTPNDIKKLFAEAIANVLDNTNLIKAYAGYLRDRGDKAEAIEQFKILAERFPENEAYKEEIEELD